MKIYMVETWSDDISETSRMCNVAAFMSKESAQNYIDTFDASYDDVDFWISEYELKD